MWDNLVNGDKEKEEKGSDADGEGLNENDIPKAMNMMADFM